MIKINKPITLNTGIEIPEGAVFQYLHQTDPSLMGFRTDFFLFASQQAFQNGAQAIELKTVNGITPNQYHAISIIDHENGSPARHSTWSGLFDAMAMQAFTTISNVVIEDMQPIGIVNRTA